MRTVRGTSKGLANFDRRHAKAFGPDRAARQRKQKEDLYFALRFKRVVAKTGKAVLIRLWNDKEEWLPASQISGPNLLHPGQESGEVKVTMWLAKQRNFWMDENARGE